MPQRDNMTEVKPQMRFRHPPEEREHLEPNRLAGQNIGRKHQTRSAAELNEAVRALDGFRPEELREVRVVVAGERLEEGATYVDLRDPLREPFTARGDIEVEEGSLYIPKQEVAFEHWRRIVDPDEPER